VINKCQFSCSYLKTEVGKSAKSLVPLLEPSQAKEKENEQDISSMIFCLTLGDTLMASAHCDLTAAWSARTRS
jgi:hypothetical protein